jgi:hypothetical protein
MLAAAERIDWLLAASAKALSFVVVVPGWTEMAAWNVLGQSQFNRRLVLVAKADHGFANGTAAYCPRPHPSPRTLFRVYGGLDLDILRRIHTSMAHPPSRTRGLKGGHRYRDRYAESPYDTAIFFQQNAAGAARWPATAAVRLLLQSMAESDQRQK